MISTVGVVTFSVSGVADIKSATIDFGPADGGPRVSAPVDLAAADYRTLLLGLKPSSPYVFRVSMTGSAGICTSPELTLMTGAVPDPVYTIADGYVVSGTVPKLSVNIMNPAAHARGFIVVTVGQLVLILDGDGVPVWWAAAGIDGAASANTIASRGHMSWDGRQMYMMRSNGAVAGVISKIDMDGSEPEVLSGLTGCTHDFTSIPGGLATLSLSSPSGGTGSILERASDGTVTPVVADLARVFNTTMHVNAIHYYLGDNSYTVSELYGSHFVKLTRKGDLIWELGGSNPKDRSKSFTGAVTWDWNHGHQLLPDGTFLFFNNHGDSDGDPRSLLRVLKLDDKALTATPVFTYEIGSVKLNLGDVQRLPNGNYLITIPADQLLEITSSGDPVMTIRGISSGYSEFRESLYGPPPY